MCSSKRASVVKWGDLAPVFIGCKSQGNYSSKNSLLAKSEYNAEMTTKCHSEVAVKHWDFTQEDSEEIEVWLCFWKRCMKWKGVNGSTFLYFMSFTAS